MSFDHIYAQAVANKGESGLTALLPKPKTTTALKKQPDSAYLAEMTACVFRSGFVWKVVENKWPQFERAFANFNPTAVAAFSDERLEALAQDPGIIRNFTKIKATRENAWFVTEIAREHGSFGKFIADWPSSDQAGLLLYLKKHGSRLGGHTGQYFLRFMRKDAYIFSRDVVRVLVAEGIVEKEPTSKSGLMAVQNAFNAWHEETGLPYCQLSRIMAASIRDD